MLRADCTEPDWLDGSRSPIPDPALDPVREAVPGRPTWSLLRALVRLILRGVWQQTGRPLWVEEVETERLSCDIQTRSPLRAKGHSLQGTSTLTTSWPAPDDRERTGTGRWAEGQLPGSRKAPAWG